MTHTTTDYGVMNDKSPRWHHKSCVWPRLIRVAKSLFDVGLLPAASTEHSVRGTASGTSILSCWSHDGAEEMPASSTYY